jgi:hypothetical protein
MSKKDNIINVSMTEDLILTFNFDKRKLDIFTDAWLVKESTLEEAKPSQEKAKKKEKTIEDIPANWGNKKVRPSKAETQFEKFINLFTLMDEIDTLEEGVSFAQIRTNLTKKGIATETSEINNLINEALSKDIIESTARFGYYRRKNTN